MIKETKACCPECLAILPGEKSVEGNDVYLLRTCPEHGFIKTLISRDAKRFFNKTFSSPRKDVHERQTKKEKGCPDDCGWCTEHKQHLCTSLIEVTGKCNLKCPVCYYGDKAGGDISFEEFKSRLDVVMRTENDKLDVLQLSGGEPTLHAEFGRILDHAASRGINRILINTNGLTMLSNEALYEKVKSLKDRVELYLQFDGFNREAGVELRGEDLLDKKLKLLEKMDKDNIKSSLAATMYKKNLDETGQIIELAVKTKNIAGITFQRLTKTGWARNNGEADVIHEDILASIDRSKFLKYDHIVPLPCSHENCTSISFLFVADEEVHPLAKYIDFAKHQAVIQNKIGFESTILDYLKDHLSCGSGGCCSCITDQMGPMKKIREFTEGKASSYKNMKMLRIAVKNFMDAYTFDTERAEKCCVGVSAGNGKLIPFCVNNIFDRRRT